MKKILFSLATLSIIIFTIIYISSEQGKIKSDQNASDSINASSVNSHLGEFDNDSMTKRNMDNDTNEVYVIEIDESINEKTEGKFSPEMEQIEKKLSAKYGGEVLKKFNKLPLIVAKITKEEAEEINRLSEVISVRISSPDIATPF